MKRALVVIAIMTGLRLILAATFPMTNDEAYYWDWGRDLQLSYFDHPPGVAWMTWLAEHLATGKLAARVLAPFAHALATLLLMLSLREWKDGQRPEALAWLIALTQLAPGLSLWGTLALPDTVLLPLASLTLYLCLRFRRRDLGVVQGLVFGSVLGLAGCAKYHALPVCGGLAVGLLLERRQLRRDLGFWLAVVAAGIVATTPVWLWNLQNHFASFRFQSAHGFAGLSLHPIFLLRAVVGQLLLVTPLVFVTAFIVAGRNRLLACGFFPLVILILGVAPFKQVLPHWIMPAFWVALPAVAASLRTTRWAVTQTVVLGAIAWILPWGLATASLRDRLLTAMHGNPSHLAELTLWPDLAQAVTQQGLFAAELSDQETNARCGGVVVVTQRWFWGAQLAFHLPHQPRVRVLDANRGSFYDQRDRWADVANCPALVLADADHLDEELLSRHLRITAAPTRLRVPRHEQLEVVVAKGVMQ